MTDPVFFQPQRSFTLSEIATLVGGQIAAGDPDLVIERVAALDLAGPGDIAFLDNPRYLAAFTKTRAAACICEPKFAARAPEGVAILTADQPYRAVAMLLQALYPAATRLKGATGIAGVSPAAHIHPGARLEVDVTVEPGAVIAHGAEIGSGTIIGANAVIGEGVRIGRDVYIAANATVINALVGNRVIIHPGVRIGQDGFGFAMGPKGHLKVPQIGRVVIQDDVEIGANTTIDRGSSRDTIIGEGTKIDNGVQIGHNVVVGRHCVLVAQVGISGSTVLGDFVALGGQAGLAGHITIGAGAQVGGASSVKDDVPPGARVIGYPAQPIKDFMRDQMTLRRLGKASTGDNKT